MSCDICGQEHDYGAADPITWDMGDSIPADVLSVTDYTDGDCSSCDPSWGRTLNSSDEWKGYKDGGSSYLSEAELLRRWGPVTAVVRAGAEETG